MHTDISKIEVPAGHRLMVALDASGDTKTIWNPANPDETANAKRTFEDLTKKGYLAFSVNSDGSKGEQITRFDPEAGKVLLIPQMRGG